MLKPPTILTLCFIICSFFAKANMDCIWTSSGKGVTISLVASCDKKNKSLADSFLNQVILKLNRKDTFLKVLVLINDARISYPNSQKTNFISVAFDTLRRIDNGFITDYYFDKEKKSIKENNGANYYKSYSKPLDINSSVLDTIKETGIKIIYRTDYRVVRSNWKEIEQLIQYAVNNSERIKEMQKRDIVRYDYNGWYVTLLTLDTNRINEILGRPVNKKPIVNLGNSNIKYYILGSTILLLITTFIIWWRQHNR